MIYFDNAATSFYKPKSVKNAVNKAMDIYTANPGRSGHKLAQMVAEQIFNVRENLKDFFNATNYELIFTKNCTEALNIAILGTLKSGDHVVITSYEHNSVLRPLEYLKTKGVEVTVLNCNLSDFCYNFERYLKPNTKLVITTMVSNVTGDVCCVDKVSKICKQNNIKYLIDGAQASGHIEINLEKIDADYFAFAGHKGLMSLTGVGGLLVKDLKGLNPIMFGGTGTNSISLVQPTDEIEGFESGTVASISIISLGAGVDFLSKNFKKIIKTEQNLSKYLINSLKKLDILEIYSSTDSLNVFSFNIKNFDSMMVANLLNEKFNICVRSGLHCAPLIHKKLNTLQTGAIRVSIDFNNTKEEIDYLIFALTKIANG